MLIADICPGCLALHGGHFERCPMPEPRPPPPVPQPVEEDLEAQRARALERWIREGRL